MTLKRGDIGTTRFPHASGERGKKRPVLVVQADAYNSKLRHVIVAEITTNLSAANDQANVLIDVSTPDGKASGLEQNSVIGCLFLATIYADRVEVIGRLSESIMGQVDDCLRSVLDVE